MKIKIKSILGSLLFECEAGSFKEAVMGAIARGADLRGADLRDADLMDADLRDADLMGADLMGANLMGADLRDADLMGANLMGANLRCADLMGANLMGANLRCADLRDADLMGAANIFLQCPEVGQFTAFKKCRGGRIVTILIPEDARRSSSTSRKCRCDKAVVLKIEDGDEEVQTATSSYDPSFIYEVGKEVSVPGFCEDRWQECAAGIHFFITRREAEEY